MSQEDEGHHHLRADAQRNLDRILAAAAEVFAETGRDASVAVVAERAGVGTATIFRRFPTKDDLLAAVLIERLGGIVTRERAAESIDDPEESLRQVMLVAIADSIAHRLVAETVSTALFLHPELTRLLNESAAVKARALRRAQEAGTIRADVTSGDLAMFLAAMGLAGRSLDPIAPNAWRRCFDIFLDGLRVERARPLSEAPLRGGEFRRRQVANAAADTRGSRTKHR